MTHTPRDERQPLTVTLVGGPLDGQSREIDAAHATIQFYSMPSLPPRSDDGGSQPVPRRVHVYRRYEPDWNRYVFNGSRDG